MNEVFFLIISLFCERVKILARVTYLASLQSKPNNMVVSGDLSIVVSQS